jgi:hypothetical protein
LIFCLREACEARISAQVSSQQTSPRPQVLNYLLRDHAIG